MSPTYSTFTSESYSSTTTPSGTQSVHSYSDPSGTTITESKQATGESQPTVETKHIPASGSGSSAIGSSNTQNRIEDVTDSEQAKRDKEYEEKMEDEYAKREGGA